MQETTNTDKVRQDWENYWSKKQKTTSKFYDLVADRYRQHVIERSLNYFLSKYFDNDQKILHAGSGSGEVDISARKYLDITALDISPKAIDKYKKLHGSNATAVLGDIFNLPFDDETFDGIYHLGVLEHFTQEEIHGMLKECHRVLKPNGKSVVFWPPTFGTSVTVLDSIHFILNKLLQMNVQLHPEEITRVRSKSHAIETFSDAGFEVLEYYFGPRDLFVQTVTVAKKQ